MSQTTSTALEKAIQEVHRLSAEQTAQQFDTPASISETFINSLVKIEYKDKPQLDSSGKQVERIPLVLMATYLQLVLGNKFNVTAGQKYVNITRN